MSLLSAFLNVRVSTIRILTVSFDQCAFLMATIDGFKERRFKCIYDYNGPMSDMDTRFIKTAIEKERATNFYRIVDDGMLPAGVIDTMIGPITYIPFSMRDTTRFGKPATWSTIKARLPRSGKPADIFIE